MRRRIIHLSDLGDFIKRRRLELKGDSSGGHLTQRELGERLKKYGVKPRANTTVSDWEKGKNVPLIVMPALAQALEVSPMLLFALAGALKDVPSAELLLWAEKEGLTDKQISNAIELLKVHFKKED